MQYILKKVIPFPWLRARMGKWHRKMYDIQRDRKIIDGIDLTQPI
jgi:hypothetical protein